MDLKQRYERMIYMAGFENNTYCNFEASSAKAIAGKDVLLAIFSSDGSRLLAVSGQQGLTINRSADSIEVTSKDTTGGWKAKIAGMKEWSVDNDGLYVPSDETHKELGKYFEDGNPVCTKIINGKTKKPMFGGLSVITDYSLEAPYDDAMTYSISLEGNGPLVDLSEVEGVDQMPDSLEALGTLEVTSAAGTNTGETEITVTPGLTSGNSYKYKVAANPTMPIYNQVCSTGYTAWNGSADIAAVTGQKIVVVEVDASNRAKKAGMATVTAKA